MYKRDLVRLRAERVEASKEGKREAIEKNLARAEELEERQREEWIQQRVARDAYVAAIKAAENTAGKAAAREAAREKRERAGARRLRTRRRVARSRRRLRSSAAPPRFNARGRRRRKLKHDRKLRAMERVERVENVARKKEVHLERLRRKIEEDAAKTHLLVATKAAMAEERQLQNCRRALVVSKRRQAEEVAQRKATRERWIASTKMDVSVEFAASAAAAAAKDEASSSRGNCRARVDRERFGDALPALRGSERGFETGEENAEVRRERGSRGGGGGEGGVVVGGAGPGPSAATSESNAPRERRKASAPIESQPQTVAAEA